MNISRFGLLKYEPRYGYFNVGDYIQSLAVRRFLPEVDVLVSREKLNQYTGDPLFLILNGWYMQEPQNWPPSENILPLFVAFHINESVANQLTTPKSIAYFKKHEPIGCRDYFTRNLLSEHGIEAYFSGCMTLTLRKEDYFERELESEVFICDVFADLDYTLNGSMLLRLVRSPKVLYGKLKKKMLIRALLPESIRKGAGYGRNYLPDRGYSDQRKFVLAEKQLKRLASAKLVVTSRIHIALPCLAFGTPVVFVNRNFDHSRFEGILELFHVVDGTSLSSLKQSKDTFKWRDFKNKPDYLVYREELEKTVQSKVNIFQTNVW